MNRSKRFSPEIRERAVRMVFEHQSEYESEWATMCSISSKIGCTAEALRKWVRRSETDMDASVGSVGDSYDNALAETINGLYKTEVIRRRGPWKNIEEVEYATLKWVDWFNNRRLLESTSDVPPAEYEMMYYRQLEESAMVA